VDSKCPDYSIIITLSSLVGDFVVYAGNDQSTFADRDKITINVSVTVIGWKWKVVVSPPLGKVDSSRESTFGRLFSGEIKLNNPGESRMPDNRNNPSRSPRRILPHKKFHNGASRAFWPHSQLKRLP
jgi:hypothetical protein